MDTGVWSCHFSGRAKMGRFSACLAAAIRVLASAEENVTRAPADATRRSAGEQCDGHFPRQKNSTFPRMSCGSRQSLMNWRKRTISPIERSPCRE